MSTFFDNDDYISDEERANTKAEADRSRARGLEQIKVITAAIPIIRQQETDED